MEGGMEMSTNDTVHSNGDVMTTSHPDAWQLQVLE